MRRALGLTAVSLLFGGAALADAKHPNPFLSQAKVFASQGEGDKCLKRLIQAEQKWRWNDKKDRAEIEMYGGICGYLIGETQAAEVSFKNAVKIDPKLELPKDLGPGIEGLWVKATGKAVPLSTGATARKEDPPKKTEPPPPAKTEPVVKNEPPPPPIAPAANDRKKELTADQKLEQQLAAEANAANAPPAVEKKGGRSVVLPVILAIAGVGAGGVGIFMGLQAKQHEAQFKSLDTFYSDAQMFKSQAQTEALLTNILLPAAGVLIVGALLAFILSG